MSSNVYNLSLEGKYDLHYNVIERISLAPNEFGLYLSVKT